MQNSKLCSQQGVTFLELLLVMAIILVLGLSTTSYAARFYTQNSVASTTDHLVAQLRKAQLYSFAGKQSGGVWGVKYTTSPSKKISLFLNGNAAFDEDFSIANSVSITGFTQVTFSHFQGFPTPAGPITITISGTGNNTETVTINELGVVSRN